MSKSTETPRFIKDYNSFSSTEIKDIRKIKAKIKLGPIPPDTEDWKVLHQFDNDYPEGMVCAHRINHWDRLVYELNRTTGDITFTNCRGHKWRNKSYSEDRRDLYYLLSELKSKCNTKSKRLAFNKLLNSFKFDTSK